MDTAGSPTPCRVSSLQWKLRGPHVWSPDAAINGMKSGAHSFPPGPPGGLADGGGSPHATFVFTVRLMVEAIINDTCECLIADMCSLPTALLISRYLGSR